MTDFSQTLKVIWTGSGSASLSGSVTRTGDGEDGRTVPLTALENDKPVDLDFTFLSLKLFYMRSTTGCTVETNAADHASGDIITLTAGVPIFYLSSAGMTNPFTFDVSKLYVTETDNAVGTLEIRLVRDATP